MLSAITAAEVSNELHEALYTLCLHEPELDWSLQQGIPNHPVHLAVGSSSRLGLNRCEQLSCTHLRTGGLSGPQKTQSRVAGTAGTGLSTKFPQKWPTLQRAPLLPQKSFSVQGGSPRQRTALFTQLLPNAETPHAPVCTTCFVKNPSVPPTVTTASQKSFHSPQSRPTPPNLPLAPRQELSPSSLKQSTLPQRQSFHASATPAPRQELYSQSCPKDKGGVDGKGETLLCQLAKLFRQLLNTEVKDIIYLATGLTVVNHIVEAIRSATEPALNTFQRPSFGTTSPPSATSLSWPSKASQLSGTGRRACLGALSPAVGPELHKPFAQVIDDGQQPPATSSSCTLND